MYTPIHQIHDGRIFEEEILAHVMFGLAHVPVRCYQILWNLRFRNFFRWSYSMNRSVHIENLFFFLENVNRKITSIVIDKSGARNSY